MGPLLAFGLACSCAPQGHAPFPRTELERAGGWESLSDDSARAGWGELPEGWTLAAGVLRRAPDTSRHFVGKRVFGAFELDFEWREASSAWQSGRVVLREDGTALALLGGERILRERGAELPSFRAGCVELTPAQSTPGWRLAFRPGAQELELRHVRLRDRTAPLGVPVEVFDGKSLLGWKALGNARFRVEEGELVGEVGGGAQSFLRTEREFGDFIFDVELKNELPGNSGIQVRSHETAEKRLRGYQIEIDPSARAWSGGLYDEARRGWLDDLSDDPHARAAFRGGEWNRYRIECIGPWIRAWVNDVPAADYLDARDLSGVLGLQVHSGKDTRVRWRDFRLRELGRTRWVELAVPAQEALTSTPPTSRWTFRLPGTGGDLRLACIGYEPASDRGASLLEIRGSDWSTRTAFELDARAEHELELLCHPPRVAFEVDGVRLATGPFESSDASANSALTVSIDLPARFTIESAGTTRRE